ncbi:acetate--CoA ligase [Natrialbaceae archaeon AArc-T1-2]|uniref:acetate--CoA ligase n=1 Tax=Natrialbaceae archaeon AArc-T1-2 TaxID=3053904 RepID=UPI00255A9419|nr:acetate--CoA ligase [Natrialbaceae archaeon AArc-T1-2]WIV68684.1 acetate--CoA ligase [Natrialbaceae archaeon AArc-T1-2]
MAIDEGPARSSEGRYRPPSSFVRDANVTDRTVYDRFERKWPACWEDAASLLDWSEPYDTVLEDDDAPFFRWFAGGKINAATNCVDRHCAAGRKNQLAIRWVGKRGECRTYTYRDLQREVTAFAAALRELGVEENDVVTIYLPTIPELPIAMLACARIGARHNVVFAGFAPDALVARMNGTDSSALVTCDGFYREETAIDQKRKADAAMHSLGESIPTVIVDRLGDAHALSLDSNQYVYADLVERHEGESVPPVPREATDGLFVIHTSGTTGEPKKLTHATGGYLAGTAWTSRTVFDLEPGDTYLCTADAGWITGHSYMVYGPLALGTTVLLYEGTLRYPDRHRPWELIERHAVDVFYTSPGTIRTFMKWGKEYPKEHDLSSLRLLGTVGEPIGPDTWEWFYTHVGNEACPIVDTWWQTETGSVLLSTLPAVSAMEPGSVGQPLPGIDARVVDDDGDPVDPGETGYLTISRPWPSMARSDDAETFREEYFAQFSDPDDGDWVYFTGDLARLDENGYVSIVGRVDDVLTGGEYRLGRAELEAAVMAVDGITEAAVVDGPDDRGGLSVFVTAEQGREDPDALREAVDTAIERRVGRFACPSEVFFTPELPETHSGKTMYRVLESVVADERLEGTEILRNPEIVGELATAQQK